MELTQFGSIWPIRPITKWIPLRRVFCFLYFASIFFFKSRCGLGCSWSGGLKTGGRSIGRIEFPGPKSPEFLYVDVDKQTGPRLLGDDQTVFGFFNWSQQSQNNGHFINRSPLQTFTLACYCEGVKANVYYMSKWLQIADVNLSSSFKVLWCDVNEDRAIQSDARVVPCALLNKHWITSIDFHSLVHCELSRYTLCLWNLVQEIMPSRQVLLGCVLWLPSQNTIGMIWPWDDLLIQIDIKGKSQRKFEGVQLHHLHHCFFDLKINFPIYISIYMCIIYFV